jgi:hypothetical protein
MVIVFWHYIDGIGEGGNELGAYTINSSLQLECLSLLVIFTLIQYLWVRLGAYQ